MTVQARILAARRGDDHGRSAEGESVSNRAFAGALAATVGLAIALAVSVTSLAYRAASLPTPTPTRASAQWQVYVSGAVVSPGTYAVRPGDRVADALRVAGGTTQEADLEGVNPAKLLRDGLQVHVPRRSVMTDLEER
jgi:hypothetical protein